MQRRVRLGARRRAKRINAALPQDGSVPRCCTCGKLLLRVPRSLCCPTPTGVFQCEDCFYPGTDRRPGKSSLISSDRTRWWMDLLEGGDGIG